MKATAMPPAFTTAGEELCIAWGHWAKVSEQRVRTTARPGMDGRLNRKATKLCGATMIRKIVGYVIFDDGEVLDFRGPFEVFSGDKEEIFPERRIIPIGESL